MVPGHGDARTVRPEWSLAELGIVDGQVLYLRDVIADEFTEPVVHDVGERVAQVTQGLWTAVGTPAPAPSP
ncbi:hypothetical protein NKH18_15210 [Streptomyces sp. M10(2022)]